LLTTLHYRRIKGAMIETTPSYTILTRSKKLKLHLHDLDQYSLEIHRMCK